MDVLTLTGVPLTVGAGVGMWRASRSTRDLPFAWYSVLFLTAARALFSPDRPAAFYRLLWLGLAWGVYALAYRWPQVVLRALPALAGALIAAVVGVWAFNGHSVDVWVGRNAIADLLLLILPWGPNVALWWGIAAAALLLTGSRGAFLGLVGALVWLIWRPRWYVWSLLIGVLLIGLVFIRPGSAEQRVAIWGDAVQQIVQSPLIGVGIGAKISASVDGGQPHAHNILLDALLDGGVFLGLAWALLLYEVYRLVMGPPGSPARLGLLAVMIHGLVDCTLWSPVLLLAALNLALLVRHRETETVVDICGGAPAARGAPAAA